MVSGAAGDCQFPLNLTNLACDIVKSTLDDAPHDRGTFLNGGRYAGVAGEAAAGFLEAEKAFRRLRGHKTFQRSSTLFGLLSFNTKRAHNYSCHPL